MVAQHRCRPPRSYFAAASVESRTNEPRRVRKFDVNLAAQVSQLFAKTRRVGITGCRKYVTRGRGTCDRDQCHLGRSVPVVLNWIVVVLLSAEAVSPVERTVNLGRTQTRIPAEHLRRAGEFTRG